MSLRGSPRSLADMMRREIFRRVVDIRPLSDTGYVRWRTRGDDRVRESHRHVGGEVREAGKEFSNGCRFPGDPTAPIEEWINCRCWLEDVEGP